MDVHPPHGPLHGWKDFWIHLGTITVGLLIAISLEQSVEWVHREHLRHQLQADLRQEGLKNHAIVLGDLRRFAVEREWLIAVRGDVDRMHASGGALKMVYRAKPTIDPEDGGKPLVHLALPWDAVWSTAKESSLLELLPRVQAEVYARLYRQQEMLSNAFNAFIVEVAELRSFEMRFDDATPGSTPELARMTVEQLDQYSAALTKDIVSRDLVVSRLYNFDAADQAVLSGANSEEEMLQGMSQRLSDKDK